MRRRHWREVARELRRTPALLLVQKVVRQIPFRPFDIGKLCFLRLDGVPRIPPSMLRGPGTVREASPADLEALGRLQPRIDEFRRRLTAGDRCAVAVVGEHIVGYEWFSEQRTHVERYWGCTIHISDGGVYAYDAYIDPAYRNSGIWLRFKAYLAAWMTARGKRSVLTFIDYGNEPSLRTHLRFGFQRADTVLAIKLLGWAFFAPRMTHAAAHPRACVGCDSADVFGADTRSRVALRQAAGQRAADG